MRIINFDGHNVTVIETEDKRIPRGIEEAFTLKEFNRFFGIDYTGYTSVIYEPQRGLYIVETPKETESFENPDDSEILSLIKSREDEIIDYLVIQELKKNIPSRFHRIENFKYVLPEEYKEAYRKYSKEQESYGFLMSTMFYALREIEETLDPKSKKTTEALFEDPIMKRRLESYKNISKDFWESKTVRKDSGNL